MNKPVAAVSLKMYFTRSRTLDYCRDLKRLIVGESGISDNVRLAVLPDFLTVPQAAEILKDSGIFLGAQDLAYEDRGAFTGEVSGADLAELGVRIVEIGHAERRTIFREDDDMVAKKVLAAKRNGIIPLLCIGEPEKTTAKQAAKLCVEQVRSALKYGTPAEMWLGYEPYWAIGAAEPASSEYVSEVCRNIREGLPELSSVTILYGGSAGPGLITKLDSAIDGLFLGRFAHDPKAFLEVAKETLARS